VAALMALMWQDNPASWAETARNIAARWTAALDSALSAAVAAWTDVVTADPEGAKARTERMLRDLYDVETGAFAWAGRLGAAERDILAAQGQAGLDAARAALGARLGLPADQVGYEATLNRLKALGDTLLHQAQRVGVAPIVVAGLAVAWTGLCWAYGKAQDAATELARTKVASDMLTAKVANPDLDLSSIATVAEQKPDTGGGLGGLVVGGLVVAGVVAAAAYAARRTS
jgi:hypothetical protein